MFQVTFTFDVIVLQGTINSEIQFWDMKYVSRAVKVKFIFNVLQIYITVVLQNAQRFQIVKTIGRETGAYMASNVLDSEIAEESCHCTTFVLASSR